jgi:hypothetical protein
MNNPNRDLPKSFSDVFNAELVEIDKRRQRYGFGASPPASPHVAEPTPEHEQVEREPLTEDAQFPSSDPVETSNVDADKKQRINLSANKPETDPLRETLSGLALSGGGIRSATFCLGVLQALNDLNLLFAFDYLSTVSGGGFVGGWWSAWLARKPARQPQEAASVPLDALPTEVHLPPRVKFIEKRLIHEGVMSLNERDTLLSWSDDSSFRTAVLKLFEMTSLFPPEERIEPKRASAYQLAGPSMSVSDSSINAGVDPIHHLRLFGNYLTPRKGWLSADTWRAVSVFSRNLVLTWLMLFPILLAFVLAGRTYFAITEPEPTAISQSISDTTTSSAVPGLAADAKPTTSVSSKLEPEVAHNVPAPQQYPATNPQIDKHLHHLLFYTTLPAIAAVLWMAVISGWWFYLVITESDRSIENPSETPIAQANEKNRQKNQSFRAKLARAGGAIVRNTNNVGLARFSLAAAFIMIVAILIQMWSHVQSAIPTEGNHSKPLIIVIAWLLAFPLGEVVSVLIQRDRPSRLADASSTEVRRNWLIRRQAEVFVAGVMLTGLFFIVGPGPQLIDLAIIWGGNYIRSVGWATILLSAAGAIFTALRNAPTGGVDARGGPESGLITTIIMRITPPLVLIVLLTLLANFCRDLIVTFDHHSNPPFLMKIGLSGCAIVGAVFAIAELSQVRKSGRWMFFIIETSVAILAAVLQIIAFTVRRNHWHFDQSCGQVYFDAGVLVMALTWVLVFGCMADPNELSLHAFYKARLVRAYLGASNMNRHGDNTRLRNFQVTEAVAGDDLPLNNLVRNCGLGGPFHLINVTLNLVAARDLGTAQRHAASYVFSSLYCGSDRTGYRPTAGSTAQDSYMAERLSLGTAVAISGAAVSPNMGSVSTTSAQAMLLTLANVRLGFWAPTPNFHRWNESQPRHWPFFMLREFFSNTNDQSSYCYLTDGGHFDNTSLYPLVQRGCRNILLADCGADPAPPCFADLGDAIRRCRIDFGAEITLDLDPLLANDPEKRFHWTIGTISYSETHALSLGWGGDLKDEKNRQGFIIVIKPTLTSTEPCDVRQYGFQNRSFPQQSTSDQWFDEAQFESYRKLGLVSAQELFADSSKDEIFVRGLKTPGVFPVEAIDRLFSQVRGRAPKTPNT